ncbi:jacalin-related lectin 3 [Jatropha curcas]|uniref:jacalin-related lectin 3 n=1 Tax=Jatropha curcas TaxID=180498 RepID=UPI0018957DC3|nr:jacalin-related lectin 3 [Jatropha curcas]
MKKAVIVGPFGGESENSWDHGVHTTVRQMFLHCGMVVDYIAVEYDENGSSKWSDGKVYIGGNPNKDFQIKLDYPNEYLTSISGYYNVFMGRIYICSMVVKSNRRVFGPFGTKEEGNYFLVPSNIGKIVGFFGSYDPYLTSVGVYVEPTDHFKSFGPFGGNGGAYWDDGTYTTIKRITVVSESVINSIHIEYDNNGTLVSSTKHGGSGGGTADVVDLYPDGI